MKRKPFMIVIVFLVLGFAIGIIGKVVSFRQKRVPIHIDSSLERLPEEQIQRLRETYPLREESASNCDRITLDTLEEFMDRIPIVALCTVQKQLEDYTIKIDTPVEDNTNLHIAIEFEQYQLIVNECITENKELEGTLITVAIRKQEKENYISMSEGNQILIPLEAMSGSHTGKYMIGYDISYYMVDNYLLTAYANDYHLNGLRFDKAKAQMKQCIK